MHSSRPLQAATARQWIRKASPYDSSTKRSRPWSRRPPRQSTPSELQVLTDIAELVDEHRAGVEPPDAVQPVKGVVIVPGHDHLQRQFGGDLGDAVIRPAAGG